jgi:hypothetical protein
MNGPAASRLVGTEDGMDELPPGPELDPTPVDHDDPFGALLPQLIGYDELTRRTRLSADVFRRARQRGELTSWGTRGRALFDAAEVAVWLRNRGKTSSRRATVYAAGPAGLPGSRVHF